MRKLFNLSIVLFVLFWCFTILAQESMLVTDPKQVVETNMLNPDAECTGTGSLIYDDNTFENGYGWNPVVTDGRFVQLFTPTQYPWQFNTFCLALTRLAAGTPTFTFDIVMYENSGGLPGNEIGIVSGVTATNIPIWTSLAYYDFDISAMPALASGSVFIGIKYNPSLDASPHYSGADESTTTPLNPGYAWSGTSWTTIQTSFAGYRAMSYRTIGSSGPPCPVVAPTNPSPANGAIDIPITGNTATWTNSAGTTQVEVWFGEVGNLVQVYSGTAINSISLAGVEPLDYFTDYGWRVVCKNDTCGTQGPTWTFTTIQDPNLATLFCDDFTSGAGNWTITNDGGVCVWEIRVISGETYTLPATAVGNCLALDVDDCNGTTGNGLSTATHTGIDASLYQTVWLEFDNDWQPIGTADFAIVDVSVDGGATWQNVFTWNDVDVRNTHEIWDLTSLVALSNFSIRFKSIQPGWDWWWAVDNICIYATDMIPVELTSFTAIADYGVVELQWITATETNNQGFEVQRSAGGEFETIAFVDGHGTTTEIQAYSYSDKKLDVGLYSYRLKQIDFDGTFTYSEEVNVEVEIPVEYALEQNYPNPFNPSTTIKYSIAEDGLVKIAVFNMLGEQVATLVNTQQKAGRYEVNFNASELSSGVYVYRIEAANYTESKKLMLMK
jgi:hypothetical protein